MTTKVPKSVYDFVVKDAKGDVVDLSFYKGKVLLIVNVASQCGLTNSNYTELNQLYDKYNCWSYSTAWRFWHFHVTNLVSKNQKAMIKLWILSALASNLNSPSFISEWGQLCSFVQILEVGGNGEFLVMIFSGTFPSSWLIRMDK
eukprot:XP_025979652.1 uncharacterized protein LOC100819033 isoform X1 [Glycine max]